MGVRIMFTKDLSFDETEIKFASEKALKFEGYASVFNGLDDYGDTILPGAYKATLESRKRPPMMFFGHNPGRVVGKWSHLEEDSRGLLGAGELTPGHTDAENIGASMRHGTISGLSIGFRIPQGGAIKVDPNDAKDGEATRILKQIDLVEISIVSMPADDEARISLDSVKAAIDALTTIREWEDYLRDAGGFSRSAAGALVSQFKAICQRDSGSQQEVDELRDALTKRVMDSTFSFSNLLKGGLK